MGVKCPKHNQELVLEKTYLRVHQMSYPVVIGRCPVCRTCFINQDFVPASGSVTINNKRYIYLNTLSKVYPPKPGMTAKDLSAAKKEKAARKAAKKERQAKRKEAELAAERERTQQIAEANKRSQAAKEASKEAAILEVRQRNAQGLSKSYHVKRISYLPAIPAECPHDGEQLDFVKTVEISTGTTAINQSAWCCFRCKSAFFLNSEREKISALINQAEKEATPKPKRAPVGKPPQPDKNLPVNLATQDNTLYVCKGTSACKRDGHKLEAATGILLGKNDIIIKINTNYCPQCRKYFIGHDEYVRYRQIYGVLLGNIRITNGSFIQSEADLADESILHMCGYSVNQADNLTAAERQGILQYLIDSKVSSKPEIIDYLNFFVKRNGKRKNMEEAVRRWNEDLRWVREYQINRQRHFEIANIQKNKN